jgi:transposase
MMGMHQKQTELWVEPVNLARRIPEDHFLRKLNKTLDLAFVRDEVSRCYGRNGNVSVDPVIIMKMMLLLFLDNVKSERELVRTIPLRIDYLWYLGYGLEDEVPNHSVLSKARRRWGVDIFERLFKLTVEKCVSAGLVEGGKLHVDSSLVRANASKNSIVETACKEVLARLDSEEAPQKEEGSKRKAPKSVNRTKSSTTDPDCTLVRHGNGKSEPSYKHHRVLDDKAGVITAIKTTTGSVNEAHELVELTEEHQSNTGSRPEVVVADCKYGITENFVALGEKSIATHMGDLRSRLKNHRLEGIFDSSEFKYNDESDAYSCPAGQSLHLRHFAHHRGYAEYTTRRGVCTQCSLRTQCTRSRNGRTINRYPQQAILDRARQQSASQSGIEDRKRRQHFQERNFADAANHHGFKRSRWRGLWRQSLQDNLIAAIQNLRLLIRRCLGSLGGHQPFVGGLCALLAAMTSIFRGDFTFHPPIQTDAA